MAAGVRAGPGPGGAGLEAWSHAKYGDLANYVPDDVAELELATMASLEGAGDEQTLLRSFFKAARLSLD